MAKATGLIFSLLDITSAQEVPLLHTPVHSALMNLPVSSFVCHSSLLTAKHVDLVMAHDGFISQQYFSQ